MLAVLVAALGMAGCRQPADPEPIAVPCADIVAGCGLPRDHLNIRFDRPPQPLRPFKVVVELQGAQQLHAQFAMRGMEMGLNRYRFRPEGSGRWVAEVTLPVCVQGRRDWLMLLEADGRRYAVAFSSG